MSKPLTGSVRIYRGYYDDVNGEEKYEWLLAQNKKLAEEEFAKRFPHIQFKKIKQKG